jgi:hypothetical protein
MQKSLKHLTIFLICAFSVHSDVSSSRIQIETIRSGILPNQVTTGSGNASKLNFKKLYKQKSGAGMTFVVSKETKRNVKYFRSIKNAMIADLADQDPKIFKPDDDRYWTIASKRGFFFNIASIVCKTFGILEITDRLYSLLLGVLRQVSLG